LLLVGLLDGGQDDRGRWFVLVSSIEAFERSRKAKEPTGGVAA
jgi:hypothetical protein